MMTVLKKLKIDLSTIESTDDFYRNLSYLFGFPDFFGFNPNALIDCLFNLRFPESGMTNILLSDDEFVLLEVHHLSSATDEIKEILIFSLENVSLKCKEKKVNTPILLTLN